MGCVLSVGGQLCTDGLRTRPAVKMDRKADHGTPPPCVHTVDYVTTALLSRGEVRFPTP